MLTASPIIKSAIWKGRIRKLRQLELHTSTPLGIFIGLGSQILVLILGIRYVFPY